MTQTSVRELKANLSKYLRQVEDGQTITITKRGKPIGRIVPERASLDERMQALMEAGLARWNGRKLEPAEPQVVNQSGTLISDIVAENRDVDYLSGYQRTD